MDPPVQIRLMLFNYKIRLSYCCDWRQLSPPLLWRFVSMLIRIRRSKDLLLQFQSLKCSSLFASNSCVYCKTRYNKCGRIGTKWLFFFTFIEECCVVIEKNTDKKLANRISYQIWHKRCLKGKFGRGVQICEGGSKSTGGPNALWHRDDVTSSLKYYQLTSEILDYKLILYGSGYFDHNMEKM